MNTYSSFLCCPKCKKELSYDLPIEPGEVLPATLDCQPCKNKFKTDEGFIHFINDEDVFRFSRRQEFFRSIYASLYTPITNVMFIPCGGVKCARREVLGQLEIKPGNSVLETGIGTGDNIPAIMPVLKEGTYFGLDNQLRMLRSCAENLKKWNYTARLIRANAEELPFKDNSFDVVFHLGAFNLFRRKKQAMDEMIRVAKPGSRIVIADESEKASKLYSILLGKQEPVVPPIDIVPSSMLEKRLASIWKGYGYLLTFRKPG